MLGENLSLREKVVANSTMLSLMDLNVITPPPYLENLHKMSYSTISRQNYFNRRYQAIFARFKKLSLVIVLHKHPDRDNYLLGDLLWDLLKNTGGLNSIYKSI